VLDDYMPAAVPADEVAQALSDAIAESGAQSAKDMGKVMKVLSARFAGRPIDNKALSEQVRARLSGG
jgi:uncharacterized protein